VRFLNVTGSPSTNAMFGIKAPEGRTPFQGGSLYITSPRAEAPDFAKPTSRLAFWRHLPQHEGRHSFSDGGLGYSVRPLCGRKKTAKLQGALLATPRESQATPQNWPRVPCTSRVPIKKC